MVEINSKMPDVQLQRLKKDVYDTEPFSTYEEVAKLGKVLLRTLPGAFTKTCHEEDLPDLKENFPALKGIYDKIIILTTDTVEVSQIWQQTLGLVDEKVEFWSDPARKLIGHFDSIDYTQYGRYIDYRRAGYIFENGTATFKQLEETDDKCEVTNAKKMLEADLFI